MDEIIEELRELAEDVPVPLELPEHDDTVEAEEVILLPLPWEFRQYLLTVSDVVYGYLEPVTVSDPSSHTYLPEVAAMAWSLGLPRDVFPICEADGGYYCMDPEGIVKFWRGGFDNEQWDSIWHWVRDVWIAGGLT